jgi:hypothetical protein
LRLTRILLRSYELGTSSIPRSTRA